MDGTFSHKTQQNTIALQSECVYDLEPYMRNFDQVVPSECLAVEQEYHLKEKMVQEFIWEIYWELEKLGFWKVWDPIDTRVDRKEPVILSFLLFRLFPLYFLFVISIAVARVFSPTATAIDSYKKFWEPGVMPASFLLSYI